MRLEGKVAIVVGAGSRGPEMGNGKATALLLAKEGAKVFAVDKNLSAAEDTVKIIKDGGGEAAAMQADVTKEPEAQKVVESAVAKFGRLDIVFNNVGIEANVGGLKVSEKDWDAVINTNLKSILFVCKYAVPEMKKVGGGAIVNNASTAAFASYHEYGYAASKAGVVGFTRSLAGGMGKYNIRVNCVAPGYIATPMGSPVMRGEVDHIIAQRVPLRRRGRPEDVAGAVLFLASDDSSYITGQTICVDGGLLIT